MKKKLKLEDLKVKSFVTSLEDEGKSQVGGTHPTIPLATIGYASPIVKDLIYHQASIDDCCHFSWGQENCDKHTKNFCSVLHCD